MDVLRTRSNPLPGNGAGGSPFAEASLRLIDANVNRAREGLRVLEDTARFVWNDPALFNRLRRGRHRLDRVTRAAYPRLVNSRDSGGDLGRQMKEAARRTAEGLVAANFRRVEEALRVLEEYGKVLSPHSAGVFKGLRFEMYIAEKDARAYGGGVSRAGKKGRGGEG